MEWYDVINEHFKDLHKPKNDITGAVREGLESVASKLYDATKGYKKPSTVRKYLRNLPASNPGRFI